MAKQPDVQILSVEFKSAVGHSKAPVNTLVSKQYHEFFNIFEESTAHGLPPHHLIDHEMVLQEGQQLPFGPLYGMSQSKLATLKEYIDERLAKGYI